MCAHDALKLKVSSSVFPVEPPDSELRLRAMRLGGGVFRSLHVETGDAALAHELHANGYATVRARHPEADAENAQVEAAAV